MKSILVALGILIGVGAHAQTYEVRAVIDSSITLLRTYALHGQRPDWDYVRERAYELAGKASSPGNATQVNDLGPAISWLFECVNDHNGRLTIGDTTFRWERTETPVLSEAVRQGLAEGRPIVQKMLPGRVGYLRISGAAADGVADSLYALEAAGASKLIIDLRLDAGESFIPVIEGLSPLLGSGPFLSFADSRGKILESFPGQASRKHHILNEKTPVVIIAGHGTARAGECVAVAFKGRKHTIFIGEPTAGYTTGNNSHWIVNGEVGIVMAESMLADRKGRCYPSNLVPDQWAPGGDDFSDYGKDRKIQTAIDWLKFR